MFRSALPALLLPLAALAEPAPGGPMALLRQIDEGFVAVFEKVAPSVVVIMADKKIEDEEREELKSFESLLQDGKEPRGEGAERPWRLPSSRSEGSGFIIRAEGYVLTNHHVVAEAEKLTVRLKDGRTFPGRIVGVDEKTDIALLRIEARELPAAEVGDSDRIRVGQLVCAIGAPFNQDFSFSVGWVSGKGRTNLLGATSTSILYEDYIQTDTFINPGNSGGPLFDVEGRVIGMNTLINGIGRGLAFAIPSSMFQEVAQQLIAHGRVQRPWLGIRMDNRNDRPLPRAKGVTIETIESGSPAFKSDLRASDVVTEIDGVKVAAPLELLKEILKKRIGATVRLTVWRAGATVQVPIAIEELPDEITPVANPHPGKLGVEPKAETLGLKLRDARPAGALVVGVAAGSPAGRAQLQAQDVITEVASRPVRDAAAAAAAIGDHVREGGDKAVQLHIERKGKRTTVSITPE